MKSRASSLIGCLLGLVLAALLASADSAGAAAGYAGSVLVVDKNRGALVVGDMGPRLPTGKSEIKRRTIRVTSSTEFVRVTRAPDTAPSGWMGDYVEARLPAWAVKAGDFVAVDVTGAGGALTAVKVTVVDSSAP